MGEPGPGDLLFMAASMAAVATHAWFVALYAAVRWWESPLGRSLMAGSVAVILVASSATLRTLRILGGWELDWLPLLSAANYGLLALSGAWRTVHLRQVQRAER